MVGISKKTNEKLFENISKTSSFLEDEKEKDVSKQLLEGFAKEVDEEINKKLFKELIKKYTEVVDELQKKVKIIEELSMVDALTGVYNRNKFLTEFELEVKRSERKKSDLTLAILDIDHFKKVNDIHGHEAGDSVLIDLCRVVESNIRDIDIFARWGGEEFVIVLGDIPKDNALVVLERIRKNIEKHKFNRVGRITCSIGIINLEGNNPEKMFSRADEALYKAKRQGRNRIEVWKVDDDNEGK